MCVSDLVRVFGGELLPLFDAGGAAAPARSLLGALLAKGASNDKRFVIEEVTSARLGLCLCSGRMRRRAHLIDASSIVV